MLDLIREHAALLAQYGRAQRHCSDVLAAQAQEISSLHQQLIRQRARTMVQLSLLAWEREDQARAFASKPAPKPAPLQVMHRPILWIRQSQAASAPLRELVRCDTAVQGSQGSTDDDAALEASLAAADMVICQTGCLSHNAYWRVQDHCKRTGKTCVLMDDPASAEPERPACVSRVN